MRIDHTQRGCESPLLQKDYRDALNNLNVHLDKYEVPEETKGVRDFLLKRKPHLFIATPSRNSQCYIGYAASLAALTAACVANNVEVSMDQVRNSCFADVSRNMLLKRFLGTKATHCLMIDDDMSWNPFYAPLKMLTYEKDFIGGAGPIKGAKKFAAELIEDQGELVTVRELGGAFILLSREMVLKMVKGYQHLAHPIYLGFPRLFEDKYTETQWITEDYVFCDRWRQLGEEVYCYPDIYFEHLGNYAVEGSYRKYINDTRRMENAA